MLMIEPNYVDWIGRKITKRSGKPFKSTFKNGMVCDIQLNPNTNKPAFLMDDGSVVDCYICRLVEEEKD